MAMDEYVMQCAGLVGKVACSKSDGVCAIRLSISADENRRKLFRRELQAVISPYNSRFRKGEELRGVISPIS
ncbi:hypothetical protein P5G65_17055 [Paenibacillus chondroitinus]|uniref:S1 motif domain-containing protein n=1 Tax=Paenibacillus chondroitinus TaxID=59842 RepID=A0ABU6DCZ3_9BACL|nr:MULTISPECIES: hypothetical protein [Paenibacillus]MCY9662992.1 hypothetical protein [Paenibacillus anseongense]MEB4795613.1 hypothetical protein [Paenibacillus chondroitinus]